MTNIKHDTIKANIPEFNINFFEEHNKNKNISTSMHLHREIELMRVKKGKVIYRIFGKSKEYILNENDIVFVNVSIPHETKSLIDDTIVQILQFNPHTFVAEKGKSFSRYISAFLNVHNKDITILSKDANSELARCFDNINNEYKTMQAGYEFNILGNLYLVLGQLFKSKSILPCISNDSEMSRVNDIFEYVERNYMNKITMKEVCKDNYISPSHFCRVFKNTTGKSFVDYLNFRRAYEAEKLLSKTNMTVTDIAFSVGFSTTSYFDRVFKKYYKISPSKYRKVNKE